MSILRRMRAAAVVGVMWAVAWAIFGAMLATWRVFTAPRQLAITIPHWPRMGMIGGLGFAVLGFSAGILFAASLSRTARNGTVDDISLAGAARWGSLAGAAPVLVIGLLGPLPGTALMIPAAIFACVGAATAMLTVSAVRQSVSSTRYTGPRTLPVD